MLERYEKMCHKNMTELSKYNAKEHNIREQKRNQVNRELQLKQRELEMKEECDDRQKQQHRFNLTRDHIRFYREMREEFGWSNKRIRRMYHDMAQLCDTDEALHRESEEEKDDDKDDEKSKNDQKKK